MTTEHEPSRGNPFETGGADYARHRPTYPPALVDFLADHCARTELAVDVGCGNGQLSRLLTARFAKVIATDASADQLQSARAHDGLVFRCEPAEAMSLDDASADLVVAAQAAHWFDLDRFFSEVQRVGRPGGLIALVTYGVPQLDGELGAIFQRFYWREDIHGLWPRERLHVESGYRDFAFPFEEIAPPPVAIERDWTLADLTGYIQTWSAVKKARAEGKMDGYDAFLAALAAAWGDPDARRRVYWPITGRFGRIS